MWKTVGVVVGGVIVGLVALAGVWFLGMRNKWGPVLDFQRKVNRKVVNPKQMRSAGKPGAYAAVVRHVGRRSGVAYETPVVPFATADGFVIVLPYGARPDWVRDVLAAGSAELVHEGETYRVCEPVVRAVQPGELPEKEMKGMRLFGNTECLAVRHSS